MINWYPWLNHTYRQIINASQQGRGHHALLIHSLAGNGADALCYGISRWLMCQSPEGLKSCGHCHGCRLMLAKTHPDYYELVPEKGKNSISVDAVRKLIEKLSSHSHQSGAKVIWLPSTEAMTDAAANALLKTLEEPAKLTYFLLQSERPESLLATLRSRCAYHHLPVPEDDIALYWLQKNAGVSYLPNAITALRLSQGAPIAAAELLVAANWQKREAFCHSLADSLQQVDMLSLLPALNQDDGTVRIHWLLGFLADAIKFQQGASEFCTNQDQLALVEQIARVQSASQLLQVFDEWQTCYHQLSTVLSLNQELLLTSQLLNWESQLRVTTV